MWKYLFWGFLAYQCTGWVGASDSGFESPNFYKSAEELGPKEDEQQATRVKRKTRRGKRGVRGGKGKQSLDHCNQGLLRQCLEPHLPVEQPMAEASMPEGDPSVPQEEPVEDILTFYASPINLRKNTMIQLSVRRTISGDAMPFLDRSFIKEASNDPVQYENFIESLITSFNSALNVVSRKHEFLGLVLENIKDEKIKTSFVNQQKEAALCYTELEILKAQVNRKKENPGLRIRYSGFEDLYDKDPIQRE